jgi:hypothetical protein
LPIDAMLTFPIMELARSRNTPFQQQMAVSAL